MTLVNQRVCGWPSACGLIESMLKAGCYAQGKRLPTEQGTPQGGVISPLLSNILLTPFDREMRRRGYQLTRYADDWVVTCRSSGRSESGISQLPGRSLEKLGVVLHSREDPYCPCSARV